MKKSIVFALAAVMLCGCSGKDTESVTYGKANDLFAVQTEPAIVPPTEEETSEPVQTEQTAETEEETQAATENISDKMPNEFPNFEAGYEGETKRVGSEEFGFVDLPSEWEKCESGSDRPSLSYESPDGSGKVVMFSYGEADLVETAYTQSFYLHNQSSGSEYHINGYRCFRDVSCPYKTGEFYSDWYIESMDGTICHVRFIGDRKTADIADMLMPTYSDGTGLPEFEEYRLPDDDYGEKTSLFGDERYGYIRLPSDWKRNENKKRNAIIFFSPDEKESVIIYIPNHRLYNISDVEELMKYEWRMDRAFGYYEDSEIFRCDIGGKRAYRRSFCPSETGKHYVEFNIETAKDSIVTVQFTGGSDIGDKADRLIKTFMKE